MDQKSEVKINPLLVEAIAGRRLIRLRYKGKERILEPHDYGIHNGVNKLFSFQVGGSSSQKLPNWRWIEEDLTSGIQILERTFPGGRPSSSGKHHNWDRLFIRVEPAS